MVVLRRKTPILLGALIGVAGGCGDSSAKDCVNAGDAEVCAVSEDGAVTFTVEGLEPGSELIIDPGPGEAATYIVGPDGGVGNDGSIGFLSLFAGTELVIEVMGVTAGGEALGGSLTATT